MKYFLQVIMISMLIFSAACKHKPAQIINRSSVVYDKNNRLNKEKYSSSYNKSDYSPRISSNDGEVVVRPGDTLYSIARSHNIALRDLIKENNLSAPYIVKNGDSLNIPKPRYHTVQSGDTLYSISRVYNTKVDQLIELNDLKEPYSIKIGQQIKVNKFEEIKPTYAIKKTAVKPSSEEPSFIAKTLDKLNKFSWPINGPIVSKFGPKSGGLYNDGINILAKDGADVKAAEDGVVAYVGNELKGYGNLVIIKHSGGWITAYAHLKDSAVRRGQKVDQGDKIGRVGASGNVNSPQLYFGLRKGRDAVNPINYLSRA